MFKNIHLKTIFFAMLTLLSLSDAEAQKKIDYQSQYWIRHNGKFTFSDNWQLKTELEDRRFFDGNKQVDWIIPNFTLTRNIGAGWRAGVGFTYQTTTKYSVDATHHYDVTVPEFRPHQELYYNQNIKALAIEHRFRLEERWTRHYTDSSLLSGHSFKGRFRYQIQLQYPLIKKEAGAGSLTAELANELMLNLGKSTTNTFDQNRLYVGLNYDVSKNIGLELGYLNCFKERGFGKYVNINIARFTINHSIDFRKK